jgi:hypothetical protein
MRIGPVLLALALSLASARVQAQASAHVECAAAPDAVAHVRVFERWMDDVWAQGRVELVSELVHSVYVRHELDGTRTVTSADYASEITAVRRTLPGVRFLIHDCAAIGDRLWVRWTMVGTSAASGTEVRRRGMQTYRFQDNRLAETWVLMPPTQAVWP